MEKLQVASHSQHYFTTVTNHQGPGHPSYFTTQEMDGVVLYWYDSRTQLLEIRAPWVKNTNLSLWSIDIMESTHQLRMQNYLRAIMNYTNASEGYHILQKIEGCTLHDNGSVASVLSEAYNGQRFTHFNPDTANWTTDIASAQFYVDILNSNRTNNENIRDQLEKNCLVNLELLLSAGNVTLSRREEPMLEVAQEPTSNTTMALHCRAYGHYPREISMSWYKNGQRVPDEELERMTLPLPDTDFLSSLSVNVSPTPGDLYTCRVAHGSLNTPVTREWSEYKTWGSC
ncbi:major histocompatibility complex class I-related gene protein-like [Spea bombifrons]|uniref:major histocompatibility complex class I-related gene protein-like n=1 Tax=Spea bombifrons TaxID=233779 RepID=UPI00234C0201|nr:major histocompatibility complex class I-related gene protein-like [Spea bombifrons]